MGSIPSLMHPQEGPLRRKCREGSYLNVTQRRASGCLESKAGLGDETLRPRVSVSSGAFMLYIILPKGAATRVECATEGSRT